MRALPQAGEIYKHFKGNDYLIIGIGTLADNSIEDFEDCVVYKRLKDDTLWMRSITEFMSKVDTDKYPDIQQIYRFERVK